MLKDNIWKLMQEKGWSQSDLAKAAGVSEPVISMILNSKRHNPQYRTLAKVAGAFGVSVEELYPLEEQSS